MRHHSKRYHNYCKVFERLKIVFFQNLSLQEKHEFSKHFESISKTAAEYHAKRHDDKLCHLNKTPTTDTTTDTTDDTEILLVETDDEDNENVTLEEEEEQSETQSSTQKGVIMSL